MGRFTFSTESDFGYTTPQSMYSDYKQKKIRGILDYQSEILDKFMENYSSSKDISLELPTGSGKTLVGLILGEFLRRKEHKKIVENYKNKLATCPKNKYEIYQCQKSAFLNSTETSE